MSRCLVPDQIANAAGVLEQRERGPAAVFAHALGRRGDAHPHQRDVHRIGRTARGGAKGEAHTFFTRGDSKNASQLIKVSPSMIVSETSFAEGVEDCVHRIGRTARGGAKGEAHTFFTRGDSKNA